MIDGLVELLWPHVCPICEREAPGKRHVHGQCLEGLPRAKETRPDGVFACFEDDPGWFRLLHQWKYGGQRGLASIVADCMAAAVPDIPERAVLVPVPDDATRRLERGYGPVTDLARCLARLTGLRTDTRLLVRARPVPSQTTCADDRARRVNVRGAFRTGDLSRVPADRPIVLVEDQITSGATVFEAAPLLAARGAPVSIWCAARAARAPRRLDDQHLRN